MGSRLRSLLVGMAAVSLVVAAQSPPATAAIDQTPPNLTVNIKPLFVVGSRPSIVSRVVPVVTAC
jgi:hypothetical protein